MDIQPPSAGHSSEPGRNGYANTSKSPRVVKLQWKLPARLRRPVHEELDRQRRKKAQRAAIVSFERRTVNTPPPPGRPIAPLKPVGLEHHTGDVQREAHPEHRLPTPPYAGSFLRQPRTRKVSLARPQKKAKLRTSVPTARKRMNRVQVGLGAERDVPYEFAQPTSRSGAPLDAREESETGLVQKPSKRFAFPVHVSVWPFAKREETTPLRQGSAGLVVADATTKKKLIDAFGTDEM